MYCGEACPKTTYPFVSICKLVVDLESNDSFILKSHIEKLRVTVTCKGKWQEAW
jgi:hypothetical protein